MTQPRPSIQNILCPTDFSDFAARAMTRAVTLARWFKAPLTALHVVPVMTGSQLMPGPLWEGGLVGLPADLLSEREEDVESELRKVAQSYDAPDVEIRTEIVTGTPWREIESRATTLPAGLVVLGTHGRSGWDRFLMGSTTEKLIRRLPCPVLTVGPSDHASSTTPFRRILCALDLTTTSHSTLKLAFSFAEESLATITLLHVIDGERPEWFPAEPAHASREDFARAARAGAITEMYRLGKEAPGLCKVDNLATTGTPWREIVRFAEQIAADLIVVGAHGPSGLEEAFLGSTAAQTVRHAPCPVLLARPPVQAASHRVADGKTTRSPTDLVPPPP
ncbi:MAG: universal stress protein, partial [Vicinamibacteria bacterium]